MVCGTFTVKGVPKGKLDETTGLFKANDPKPTSVTSKKEDDGSYTVTAVFPKCPDETEHSPD
ncbi:MAG TPA: hypothetical protein VNR86_01165 [Sphingomicrobium sp.]|nr:hypothetical protein [Sphingomicrobium sp.]